MTFTNKILIVIGDVILDHYIRGTATRLSPEAPVPVIRVDDSSHTHNLGGAGNVAANVKSLGGYPLLISAVGYTESYRVCQLMRAAGMETSALEYAFDRPTTVKTRIIVNNQQVARMDCETTQPIDKSMVECILDATRSAIRSAGAIIVSDYAKGVITRELMEGLNKIVLETGVPLFIDPKVEHADYYRGTGITAMTPNATEAASLCRGALPLQDAGFDILRDYGHKFLLITRGESGMSLFRANKVHVESSVTHIAAEARHVFDVSGAGDTVIATLALAYASGQSMLDSVRLANKAAGIVVGKPGTSTVTNKELEHAMDSPSY